VEEKITELLQANGLVSRPQVTVFVKEQRSQPITVIGAVRRPLVFQAVRQTTLLEVLSEAVGIADDAGAVVIVRRQPKSKSTEDSTGLGNSGASPPDTSVTFTINLNDLLGGGNNPSNIPLLGGDVVSIPRAGIVYVVGAVDRPGGFVLQNDREQMTTLKVLALAGGLKGTARPHQAVILRNKGDSGHRQEVAVNLTKVLARKAEDVRLQPSDILFVPDSAGKKALRRAGETALALTAGVAVIRLAR
jgi:polysaccharide export outer membrane protein